MTDIALPLDPKGRLWVDPEEVKERKHYEPSVFGMVPVQNDEDAQAVIVLRDKEWKLKMTFKELRDAIGTG